MRRERISPRRSEPTRGQTNPVSTTSAVGGSRMLYSNFISHCRLHGNALDAAAPFRRPGLMHRLAARVDGHRDRHVLHLELVDRFHAEVAERDDAAGADCLGYEVGRAADGHEIRGLVLADG